MNRITTKVKPYTSTDYDIDNRFMLGDALFFDIETTGFSAKITSVYMIGVAYACQNNKACPANTPAAFPVTASPISQDTAGTKTQGCDLEFEVIQWFCDSPGDEAVVIAEFFEFMGNFQYLIHFNGEGFDMPYLLNKCKTYNLPYSFEGIQSIDLLKIARGMEKFLKLENLKQKTVEKFLSVERCDTYSGGELINIYQHYVKNKSDREKELLLLHNFDDVCGLISVAVITNYENIIAGNYTILGLDILPKDSRLNDNRLEAIFTAKLYRTVPKRISYGNDTYYFTAFGNTLKLKVNVYTSELKYFFPNYKDYYYLPYEDTAIHRSVAFYVDKNYRTRAKAANCYSKKTGTFLPQKEPVIEPYFKIDYYDKESYFELEDEFKNDTDKQKAYVSSVIKWLMNG